MQPSQDKSSSMTINYKSISQYSIGLLFFLFPILSIIIQHWVSFTFLILVIGGMGFGLKNWALLKTEEKNIFMGFSVFCGLIALSFFEVDDMRDGFRYFEKYTSFLFVVFSYLFLKRLNFNFAKYFLAGCVVAPVVWLTYYYATTTGRPSWAYYAIFIGDFAVLIASLSIVYLLTLADSNLKKSISWVVFLLATILAVLSETRGAWLYYPVLLFVLVFLYRKTMTPKQWLIGITVVGFMSFVLLFQPPKIIKSRIGQALIEYKYFQAGTGGYSSVGVRLEMWLDSIKIFAESPLIGIGISDFESHSKALISQGVLKPRAEYGHAHSIYFNTLATAGLLGFLGLIFFVFWLPFKFFLRIWRNADSAELRFYSLAGIVLMTSFMVFGLTESWLTRNPMVRTYLIIMVLLISSIMSSPKRDNLQ